MPHDGRKSSPSPADRERRAWVWRIALFAWLLWIPLPFASVIPGAWLPLTLTPLFLLVTWSWWSRSVAAPVVASPAACWWTLGGLTAVTFGFLQIIPLPGSLVELASPKSFTLWADAAGVVNNVSSELVPRAFSLSVDPGSTARETVGLASRLAAFVLATQLFRRSAARVGLAALLVVSAGFQVIYGIRHWSGGMMEIWGWTNRLIHGRMGGTFVNPNHLAHYLALVLPFALYLLLHAWNGTRGESSLQIRVETFFTRRPLLVLTGGAGLFFTIFGILLAKSRGVILALVVAVIVGVALFLEESSLRRGRRQRTVHKMVLVTALLVVIVIGAVTLFLGTERVTGRMVPTTEQAATLVGRVDGAVIALELWRMFPLTGSGFGTFENVSLMVHGEAGYYYRHAHNDWLEILATGGLIGFGILIIPLGLGLRALAPAAWPFVLNRPQGGAVSGSQRRFVAMGAIAIIFVLVHGLVDFNFFIPANSYTFAVLTGATMAVPSRRRNGVESRPK